MQQWCRDKTGAEVTARLEGAKLPGAPVSSPADVLSDPHVAAMGYLHRVPFPGADRPVPIIETPFRLSKTPGTIERRAPLLGEHTDEVLAEVGYDAEQIAELRAQHVV
jgi:crotonobetainyl-CoA:carnitine CoA-transferase CaiB-like acyl-CoA transferase